MIVIVVFAAVIVVLAAGVSLALYAKRSFAAAVAAAASEAADRGREDRDEAVTAAIRQVYLHNQSQMASSKEQVEAALAAKQDVIGSNLDAVRTEVRHELVRLGELVAKLGDASAQRFGQVDESLRSHADLTAKLAQSTQTLGAALANSQARGQWGERMAEDVLRVAGFVENVNYRKQVHIRTAAGETSGRPDFTFDLPKGHVVHMDVKFPLAAYLRYLEARTDLERQTELKAFLRDVRAKVKDLSRRSYQEGDKPSVDYVLMFLPNEQLTGFIHENDSTLIDEAMREKVVMCSPVTLFAFLGVIRQAFDNFMVEQRSGEILKLVGEFDSQWRRYTDSAEKLKRAFVSLHGEFDNLTTTRVNTLDRTVRQIGSLRSQRELDDAGAPMLRAVGRDD